MHDRTRRVLRRGSPVAVALLVVGGGGAVTWAATTGNGAGNYRTVAAATGNVEQLLTLTGIVAPVSEASATFAVSGTVTRVDVAAGDSVAAGQELATIDTKPLQDAVTQAEATLATAQETYAVSSDTSSASSSATGSSTTASGGGKSTTGSAATVSTGAVPVSQKSATTSRTGSSGTSSSGTGSADGGSTGGKTKDMDFSAETKAVDKASAEATTLSKAATRALSSASTACAASQPTDSTTPTPTATPTPTSTPVPTTSSPPTTAGAGSDPRTSCLAALTTVQEAQSAVATAQSALSAAQSTFGSILTGGAASLQKSGSSAAGATSTTPVTGASIGAPTASAPAASVATTAATTAATAAATPTTAAKSAATPSGGGGTAGASSAGDTASRVADANVSVLEAQNALQMARDALASATLTAPISGTVATIPFIVGGTAGTSNALTIVGTGAVRVTVDVPLASLPKVKVGQNTRVTASGATKPVGGKIESVAILPVSGTTTFPVTVLVAEPAAALASGSSATASIVLSTLTDVVTVPNSALTRTGNGTAAVVTVSSGGAVSRKQVALGAVGALSSQVQSGLKAGDQVVLADLSQAVPANSTTSTVRGAGGGGIPPGGAGAGGRPTG